MASVKSLAFGVLIAVISLIVIMEIAGETIDDIQDAGDTVNATGAPLAGLFASDSIVPLIFLAGILIAVLKVAFFA